MITGFNTDVEHGGIVYHVQTEDKGLASPLILTLVYTGGTILASKRVTYDDLIAEGFDERVLAERLTRQHKLVCAAIRTGRIEDLRRMSERVTAERTTARSKAGKRKTERKVESPAVEVSNAKVPDVAAPFATVPKETAPVNQLHADAKHLDSKTQKTTQKILPVTVRAVTKGEVADFARDGATKDDLHLSLVEEKEFRGGKTVTLNVRVGRGANGSEAADGAEVAIKILGSSFRPVLFSAKTNAQGVATVRAEFPHFSSGRAAILVRATLNGYEAELRRIVQQG